MTPVSADGGLPCYGGFEMPFSGHPAVSSFDVDRSSVEFERPSVGVEAGSVSVDG